MPPQTACRSSGAEPINSDADPDQRTGQLYGESERYGDGWEELDTVPITQFTYTDTGLAPSTPYSYRVFQGDGGMESPPSNVATATTLGTGELPAPTGVTATARSSTTIELNWDPAAPDATEFRIERLNGGWEEIGTVPANETSVLTDELLAGTTYSYRVFQGNGSMESPPSSVATETTLEDVDPDPEFDLEPQDTDGDGVFDVDDPFPNDARRKAYVPPVFHGLVETEGYLDSQFALTLGEDLRIASVSMPDSDSFRTIVWNPDGSISSDFTVDRNESTYQRLGGVPQAVSVDGKVLGYSDYGTWTAYRGEVSEFEAPSGFSNAYPFVMSRTGVIFGQAFSDDDSGATFFLSPSHTLIPHQQGLLDPRQASDSAVFASDVIGGENYLWSQTGGFEALPGAALGGINDARMAACYDGGEWHLYEDGLATRFFDKLPALFQQELRAINSLQISEVNSITDSPVISFTHLLQCGSGICW